MSKEPASYRISGIVPDNKKKPLFVQLEDTSLYSIEDILKFYNTKKFKFYTSLQDGTQTPVKMRGKKFLITLKNKTKEDNLGWLPIPALI